MLACSGVAAVFGGGDGLRSPGFLELIVHLDRSKMCMNNGRAAADF